MAEETTDKQRQPPLLVLVIVEKKKEQQQLLQEARAVQLVSLWALLTAAIFAIAFSAAYALSPLLHDQPAAKVTAPAADEEFALEARLIKCGALQAAAAAALALLLGGGRRRKIRLALAYAALAAAVGCHCTYASVIGALIADDPGHLLLRICGTLVNFVLAGGDLLCFLALLIGQLGAPWISS